jgi:hypothetical protein
VWNRAKKLTPLINVRVCKDVVLVEHGACNLISKMRRIFHILFYEIFKSKCEMLNQNKTRQNDNTNLLLYLKITNLTQLTTLTLTCCIIIF